MTLYIALRSSHGKLQETRIFNEQAAALNYANEVVANDGFEPKDSEGKPWLVNFGDDDGCGIIVAAAEVE
jgi:hypothetical protein